VIAPAPPPVVAAPAPPAPAPAVVSAGVACPGYKEKLNDAGYPRDANKAGIARGEATVEFTVGPSGEVKNPKVVQTSHPIFGRFLVKIVEEFKCTGQGHDVPGIRVTVGFKLD
jgi:periplasmic protein TonB